jgi:hypothetical protein
MNKLTREQMLELFGTYNVELLESQPYCFTQRHIGEELVEFEARISISGRGVFSDNCDQWEMSLHAFVLQDKDRVSDTDLDDLLWDKPDYYAMSTNDD